MDVSLTVEALCVEADSERRLDAEEKEEGIRDEWVWVCFDGGEAMVEDVKDRFFMYVGVAGTGSGAARLLGLAKERKTALAFGLAAEEAEGCGSLSFESEASLSASDLLRLSGLGLEDSSVSSRDLRGVAFELFLKAMVLALALGGPQ